MSYICILTLKHIYMAALNQITHEDLKVRLRTGSVKFYFRKVKGDLRIAMGTLDLSRIPDSGQPKGGQGPARCTCY